MPFSSKCGSAWVLALVYATLPFVAMAQESEEETDPSLDLGTITVTGQKSERSLAETDGSITVVFPGESGGVGGAADDIFGIAERLANVTPFTAGSGVAIRGIGQTGFASGPTFGQTSYLLTRSPSDLVATYVDGIPVSVHAGPSGLWDVDQVEVLRGAQSTVLGRGSLGGAVIIETADPTFTTTAAGQLKVGANKGGLGASFAVSGPIVEDRLAYRVASDAQSHPNFIKNTTTDEDGDRQDLLNRRVKLLYTGERGAELELSAFFSGANVGTHYVDAGLWPRKTVIQADPNTRLENHSTGVSLRGSWPLGNPSFSLESATVWAKENASSHFDIDQTETRSDTGSFKDDIRTLSQELRLRYTGDNFNGFIGAYFEDFQGRGDTSSTKVFGTKTIKQDIQTMALFGEGKWSLSEKLDLTLGLRLEQEDNEIVIDANNTINFPKANRLRGLTQKAGFNPSTVPSVPSAIGAAIRGERISPEEGSELGGLLAEVGAGTFLDKLSESNCPEPPMKLGYHLGCSGRLDIDKEDDRYFSIFLPKLGLSYEVSPETRIYGTVQRGHRAGGAGVSLISAEYFDYNPEKTWNMDLGVRHQSADGRLRLSSNLFYVDWQDQQFQVLSRVSGGVPIDFISVNVGRSKSYGLELDADYQATERLRLFGSLGLLYTKITEIKRDSQMTDNSYEKAKSWLGNSFTMAPNTTISAGWSYAFDHGLDLSMAANWRDSFFSDIQNESYEAVPSRLLVDMGVGYQFPNRDLRFDLKVTNVFNEKYLNYSYKKPLERLSGTLVSLAAVDPVNLEHLTPLAMSPSKGIVSPGNGRAVSLALTTWF